MTTTAKAAAGTILALDIGKNKTVACAYDTATGRAVFDTITTGRDELTRLFRRARPAVVVFKACALCGWVADLCAALGMPCTVASTAAEVWGRGGGGRAPTGKVVRSPEPAMSGAPSPGRDAQDGYRPLRRAGRRDGAGGRFARSADRATPPGQSSDEATSGGSLSGAGSRFLGRQSPGADPEADHAQQDQPRRRRQHDVVNE
jgi:hypothetical protein